MPICQCDEVLNEVNLMLVRKERKDAAEHRNLILQKALSLFAEYGIDSVSMHQIAKSAGIGQGTLYRRYAHKGELCLDLMEESSLRIRDKIELYLNGNRTLPIQERLETVLLYCLDFMDEESKWLSAIQAPTCEERRSIRYRSPLYEAVHSILGDLLKETKKLGCRPSLDPIFTADAIMASMAPDLYAFMRHDRGYSKADFNRSLVALYIEPLFK
jgi:TetR/AcrR family transcriptional repressor of mexAB-oprM operon